jgi:hypothetical protein
VDAVQPLDAVHDQGSEAVDVGRFTGDDDVVLPAGGVGCLHPLQIADPPDELQGTTWRGIDQYVGPYVSDSSG